jgi:hypothetical protein
MNRKIIAAAAALCVLSMLAACGGGQSANDGTAPDTGAVPSSDQSGARKIVFHDTIDDPQADDLTSLSGGASKTTGTAELDLVLSETEPDVFEGCGVMRRSVDIAQWEAGGSTQHYVYRTGLVRAEAGKEGSVTLTGWLTEDRPIPAMMDAPFEVEIHKAGTLRQENLSLLLTLDGSRASLSVKLHDYAQFVFHGELTSEDRKSVV